LALLVLNVDDFAVINDTFGYEYGDRVLDRIGRVIRSILPEAALLARISARGCPSLHFR
jgi:diguanylate cyclase (GGDEF)-like protein